MFFYYFLVVFSFDIAKIHIKLKNNKENMKITRYFKAFALSIIFALGKIKR